MKARMKIRSPHFIILLIAVIASACGNAPTPAAQPAAPTAEPPTATEVPAQLPAETPTQAPQTSADPVWDRIQAAGKVVFGTSADYPPFEFYDENQQIVGFDPALARQLGARLGLQVELRDIAFEGLPTSLQTGQIDAAIAAISVTPKRQEIMDFTNVYYSGQDIVLARQGAGIGKLSAATQLAQYRVGVERGSVYQSWIQNSLIDAGLMAQANLFAYEKPEHAVRDLKENRLDLVVMGLLPGETYISQGGVENVGQGFNTQLFGIALARGSSTLREKLNEALIQLQNDGTMAGLSTQFLNVTVDPGVAIPLPTVMIPVAPLPTPTAAPNTCYDGMEYVADVTVPDHTVMEPRQDFDKIWRVRNTGTCTWNDSYRIVFVQGDMLDGGPQRIRATVRPGETYEVGIDQTAPNRPGKYSGLWQLVNGQNAAFGPRIWVKIKVKGQEPPPTSVPAPTNPPPVQPTLAPPSLQVSISASPSSVAAGNPVNVNWNFSGGSIATARLTRTNPDGTQTALYGGADVDPQGSYDDILFDPGTYTYSISVSQEFGGTVVKTVSVQVNP